ncbi:MAG: M14 family metallopeptidase [Rickettsiales bacterium]|jgi:polar amino acid transport system ATP-binding protein|nr:M14 family metallopeptidase [Rickettsiales bacterium]
MKIYSDSYATATQKFIQAAEKYGPVKWYSHPKSDYRIPTLNLGDGPRKIVINSGMHGIEGFFGSASILRWLDGGADFLHPRYWNDFQITIIHIINGYGMDKLSRENASNVDLNRNFRDWKTAPERNDLYAIGHDLIVSDPRGNGAQTKLSLMREFHAAHKDDGVFKSLARGQYEFRDGIFYGGAGPEPEHEMIMQIYNAVMSKNAKSLLSIGLHTGCGIFRPKTKIQSQDILVSHQTNHKNTEFFRDIFGEKFGIVPDDRAEVNAAALGGDLVDYLEAQFPGAMTADLEIGTGTCISSVIKKRMDQGDRIWEMAHLGRLRKTTQAHLIESWFPTNPVWRKMAVGAMDNFASCMAQYMEKSKLK